MSTREFSNLKRNGCAKDYIIICVFQEIKDFCSIIKNVRAKKCCSRLSQISELSFASLIKRDCTPETITFVPYDENHNFSTVYRGTKNSVIK